MGLMSEQPQEKQPQQQPDMEAMKQKVQAHVGKIQKMVLVAQKLLYSDKTSNRFLAKLDGTPEAIGTLAKDVMAIIVAQVGQNIDPRIIMPSGIAIVGDLVDYTEQINEAPMPEDDVYQAIQVFVESFIAIGGQQAEQPTEQPMEVQP